MTADRSDAAVGLWNGFADRPYILRLLRGLRDDPITDQPSLMSQFKQAFQARLMRIAHRPCPARSKPSILVYLQSLGVHLA